MAYPNQNVPLLQTVIPAKPNNPAGWTKHPRYSGAGQNPGGNKPSSRPNQTNPLAEPNTRVILAEARIQEATNRHPGQTKPAGRTKHPVILAQARIQEATYRAFPSSAWTQLSPEWFPTKNAGPRIDCSRYINKISCETIFGFNTIIHYTF